jgi:membrane-associated phospholipid phosphatase
MPPCHGARAVMEVSVPYNFAASPLPLAAVLYSFVPWAVGLSVTALAVRYPKQRALVSLAVFGATAVLTNEAVLKKLVAQPRPEGSCLASQGMPSSHCIIAIGGLLVALHHLRLAGHVTPTRAALMMAMLLPVPWARVFLSDHSVTQVMAGSVIGAALALLHIKVAAPRLLGNKVVSAVVA